MVSSSSSEGSPREAGPWVLLLAYLGFISLGLPDSLLGVAWPSLRQALYLPQSGLGLVSVAGGIGYFVSSFLAGRAMAAWGVGALLAASSALVAASGAGYASARAWPMVAASALAAGVGSGAIDAGLNAFVSSRYGARQVNWLHACYSLGAALGPMVMTVALVWAGKWRAGYAAVALAMAAMALLFAATRRRWGAAPRHEEAAAAIGTMAALRRPLVWLQVAIFFVYTGLELTVGVWSFTLLTEGRGVADGTAGAWVSAYFGALCVGRVMAGLVAERLGPDRLVRGATLAAAAGTALLLPPTPPVNLAGLVLLGMALAPVYPCLMARTPARLGPAARHAFGFQVSAATAGAAALPALGGALVEWIGLEAIAPLALASAMALGLLHEALCRATPAPASATPAAWS
jgi:fucose permease